MEYGNWLLKFIASDPTGITTVAAIAAAVVVVLFGAFTIFGFPLGNQRARQTDVHGSARLATQDEAKQAANGERAPASLDNLTFED